MKRHSRPPRSNWPATTRATVDRRLRGAICCKDWWSVAAVVAPTSASSTAVGMRSRRGRATLHTQIKGVKRRIARLVEMYEEEFLDQQAFRSRMASAQSRLKKLEDEVAALVEHESGEAELRLVMG